MNKTSRNRKKEKRTLCLVLSAAMVLGLAGCGKEEAPSSPITNENQEAVLEQVLNAQINPAHSSEAGKEETVYVLADAKGSVNQIIVSDWLKNSDGGESLIDSSDLKDIRNVKGYETYETDKNGNILWKAEGSDIYYQGTTDKEVPVQVKISYQLEGKEIAPEELAGRSGKVTIRMDYENHETKMVEIGGKKEEIKIPFAMISGMVLPQDTFSNIEVTNARLLSEGNNSVVVGVAFPGLKESIDAENLKEKLEDKTGGEKADDLDIPDYIEITADAENFELGMTMTVAMSDILSDIALTDSFDLSALNNSMDDLQDATNQLKDGAVELKDGTLQLKDGSKELLSGTLKLWDGTVELRDGTQELSDKSGDLDEGAQKLDEGALALYEGTASLKDGVQRLTSGTDELQDGGYKLAAGTESLANGARSLNDGALLVKDGVNQVAGQMNNLKAGIGTPVASPGDIDPHNPTTLLQVSYLLNQSLKALSADAGLMETSYNSILSTLQQQTALAQADLNAAQANLAAAQSQAAAARTQLSDACKADILEMEVVTQTRMEEDAHIVTIDAPVTVTTKVITETITESENEDGETIVERTMEDEPEVSTETYTESFEETVTVPKEVVDTETVTVRSIDIDNLQQQIDAYQDALLETALCQAEVEACSAQVEALNNTITDLEAIKQQQLALSQKWGPSITYAAILDQKLNEISGQLNSQESAGGMAALVKGAGDLADGTQTALAGATQLNNGANELKKGIDTLSNGAGELADGANSLNDGAAALKNGTGELKDGTKKLVEGATTLNDGAGELKDGTLELKDGVLTLEEGAGDLDAGALELLNGMFEFDQEGISKLTDLFGDDVQNVVDRLEAVSNAGKAYNTFTKLPENVDGSVKFIIKTDAIK